ncbi:metal-dependent phosphohydrolase [Fictibacillus macauensis ZFHKF-1]|uniref:Metal-dependent phosphohydrolase n=1 Tax=Fictibacillus macauensis ZFHKF-1 TaxID=1196324 RepID=I8ADN0_9BACL|nr:HD domain-containing protein [Fictibacillus macauensis]EIT83662.1 metal-dependent phosphohydrolase [Fictibacillus macauensis ZFHKF-1]
MIIHSALYGSFEVEPVLRDLINCEAVQRLKKVHQGGACYLVNDAWNVTRYEHSLGVMLLLRRAGACLEEQMAGLLHDISHTAFSHVIDDVMARPQEDYHEEQMMATLLRSDIPEILARHGYDLNVLETEQWSLLERPLPDLCADRIDYTLRDLQRSGVITLSEVHAFLEALKVHEGIFYIDCIEQAMWFVDAYYKEVIDYFLHPLNVYSNAALAAILKRALREGSLQEQDFMTHDAHVINTLLQEASPGVKEAMKMLMKQRPHISVVSEQAQYDYFRRSKLRLMDPYILVNQELQRASSQSTEIANMYEKAKKKSLAGVYVKLLENLK